MSVRQLHYTSCQDGLEGIEGFQVSAATPGLPKSMVDLAVRASVYEAGPALIGRLADEDLRGFPVAFGYTTAGRAGALFQSRYAGQDFTGRLGNYFAHAVLFDDVDELAGALPIDLWRSPVWTDSPPDGVTELPVLDGVSPGEVIGQKETKRFLASDGRRRGLARLITAVQPILADQHSRLVLIVSDDRDAAHWLAALTRSLPRHLSLQVSFVTYTSRPEEQEVLISCVTPDVRVPAYGRFTVLDLTGDDDVEATEPSFYARVMADAWLADRANEVQIVADRLGPTTVANNLDEFGVVLALLTRLSLESISDERRLASAVALAERLLPGGLPPLAWQCAADTIQRTGLHAVDSWEPIVRDAFDRRKPIPPALLGAYYVAALTADTSVWSPPLDASSLADIAEHTVLPALLETAAPIAIGRLQGKHSLLQAVVSAIDRRLASGPNGVQLASTLTVGAAHLLAPQARSSPRVHEVMEIALARHGERDRVDVLARVARQGGDRLPELARLLWPNLPRSAESLSALDKLPPSVLRNTDLPERFVERILQAAEDGDIGKEEVQLAGAMLRSPYIEDMSSGGKASLEAVRAGSMFRHAVVKRVTTEQLSDALCLVGSVGPAVARHLLDGVVSFVLRVDDPIRHIELLETAMLTEPRRFGPAYCDAARERLKELSPQRIALLVMSWAALADGGFSHRLVEEVLAESIARRRRGDLDKVGAALRRMPGNEDLAKAAGVRGGGWSKWWQDWRHRHERHGLLSRLLRPRPGPRKG